MFFSSRENIIIIIMTKLVFKRISPPLKKCWLPNHLISLPTRQFHISAILTILDCLKMCIIASWRLEWEWRKCHCHVSPNIVRLIFFQIPKQFVIWTDSCLYYLSYTLFDGLCRVCHSISAQYISQSLRLTWINRSATMDDLLYLLCVLYQIHNGTMAVPCLTKVQLTGYPK